MSDGLGVLPFKWSAIAQFWSKIHFPGGAWSLALTLARASVAHRPRAGSTPSG